MPKLVAFLQFVGALVVAYFAVRVAATIWERITGKSRDQYPS